MDPVIVGGGIFLVMAILGLVLLIRNAKKAAAASARLNDRKEADERKRGASAELRGNAQSVDEWLQDDPKP